MHIARGSTYGFTINLPDGYDITNAKEIWVTFGQDRKIILDLSLTNHDFEVEENHIICNLSQEQTLEFRTGNAIMQVRILTEDDSSLVQFPPTDVRIIPILKGGVISNE
jgi:hypothetical protein